MSLEELRRKFKVKAIRRDELPQEMRIVIKAGDQNAFW